MVLPLTGPVEKASALAVTATASLAAAAMFTSLFAMVGLESVEEEAQRLLPPTDHQVIRQYVTNSATLLFKSMFSRTQIIRG